ncbi:MAG: hypothetical protein ACREME_03250 [Gemmatimonadales bacterium]
MKRTLILLALAAAVATGVRCGDSTGPRAGTLIVRLTSPNSGADSAIVLTITGPAPLTSAAPGPGLALFAQPLGGTTTRFALTGQLLHNAPILTIGVTDVGAVSQYSGTIRGVAQPDYQLRTLPGGYALAIIR